MPGPVGHAGVVAAVERLDQVLCVRGVFWRSGGVIDGDDGVVFAGLDGAGYGTGLRSTFSETRVRSMALTLRYPYPPSEAANAPATRRDARQACHRAERTRRPQPVDQQGLLPVDRRRRPTPAPNSSAARFRRMPPGNGHMISFRPVSKKTSAPCYPGGLVWRKRKDENAVDGSVAGGSGADV